MHLTKKEEELLKLIKENRYISNTQLAIELKVSKAEVVKMKKKIGKKSYAIQKRKVERHYK